MGIDLNSVSHQARQACRVTLKSMTLFVRVDAQTCLCGRQKQFVSLRQITEQYVKDASSLSH